VVTELQVAKLVAGGEGLCFLDGKSVFVPGVLPDERVRVHLIESRKDFSRGIVEEVLMASSKRVDPPCALHGICGGCDWLHVSLAEQHVQKAAILKESLRRVGRIPRESVQVVAGLALGCRNRAQIHAAPGGRLGYMGGRSNTIVTVDTCPIVSPPIDELFAGRLTPPVGLDRFTVFSDGEWVALEGVDDDRDLAVWVCGRKIAFSVGCFFQPNLAVLEILLPWALEGLEGKVAADLYCGVGLFGAALAERFAKVIAVESNSSSVAFARRNITGAEHEFHPMSVEQWITSGASRARIDTVVVDPPRAGLSAEVIGWLNAAAPPKLVYVSCNPVTLARDLGRLVAGGFSIEDMRIFDFYPQTSHLETVAKLSWVDKT
jgi:23S rRNA (uracil1939-C5)-methyltransferase